MLEAELEREKKRTRNTGPRPGGSNSPGVDRPDYWNSTWGKMLKHSELQVTGSQSRKVFTRRFRTPYPVFTALVRWAKEWHEKSSTDSCGRPRCPTELKVLGWLRMTSRAVCFDDIEELSGLSSSTMIPFFHEFSKRGREELYPVHVKMPTNFVELAEIEAAYAALGIPGACGSMDVVHVALGACPFGIINICTGKEGYPTLGYNMICDHMGRALSLMPGAYGSINDKTIVRHDDAVEMVRTNKLFTDFVFEVFNSEGVRTLTKGAYLIVDGGYHKWEILQCGLKSSSDPDYAEWRKKMESVRKDIECYFGRLKQCFKLLKIPNNLKKKIRIDDMMFTIVAIQNMILDFDIAAKEYLSWDVQMKWQNVSRIQGQEETIEEVLNNLAAAEAEDIVEENEKAWMRPVVKKKNKKGGNMEYHAQDTDFSEIGLRGNSPMTFGWENWGTPDRCELKRFKTKQTMLVNHFHWYKEANGNKRMWLRS